MFKSSVALFQHFREMRSYFILATAIFVGGIVLGAQSNMFHEFLDGQLAQLGETANTLQSLSDSWLPIMLFIFINNAVKAIVFMYLGILFGILPMLFLLVNGMVLGYLFMLIDSQGFDVVELLIKGILPHGILEIPAIVIASAYGIRLGVLLVKKIFPNLRQRFELRTLLQHTVTLMFYLTVTLFVAAVIESTITPWLLEK